MRNGTFRTEFLQARLQCTALSKLCLAPRLSSYNRKLHGSYYSLPTSTGSLCKAITLVASWHTHALSNHLSLQLTSLAGERIVRHQTCLISTHGADANREACGFHW